MSEYDSLFKGGSGVEKIYVVDFREIIIKDEVFSFFEEILSHLVPLSPQLGLRTTEFCQDSTLKTRECLLKRFTYLQKLFLKFFLGRNLKASYFRFISLKLGQKTWL